VRVLVTGARGFIGARLCARLSAAGAEVHGTTRADAGLAPDVVWHRIDLSDAGAVRELLGEVSPDVVYHLASHVSGARDVDAVLPTFDGNLTSTVTLLAAAEQLQVGRIVLAGSMEQPQAVDEVPASPYAAAKGAAAAYARMFHALYGTPVVVLRLFMVYGPGQRDLTKLVPYAGLAFLNGESPGLTSGTRLVDWVYVDDVVEAFVAALDAPAVEGRTIDIGSGVLVSIGDLVERLRRAAGSDVEPVFGAVPDRPLETMRAASLDDARELLGWQPTTTLDTGLERTLEWLAEVREGVVR
jgi:UDP-glucose 4-epimerase